MKPVRDAAPMVMFGARLRDLRRQRKLTQQGVADRLQVDRTTYTKYETGRVSPDHQGLVRLAEVFGVSVDFLLGRVETEEPRVVNDENQPMMLTLQEKVLVQMFRQIPRDRQNELVATAQRVFRERNNSY